MLYTELREAAQQALEALKRLDGWLKVRSGGTGLMPDELNIISRLRAALAEQPAEQEPVAWFYEERGRRWVTDALHEAQHANDGVITPLYTAPQPKAEQEPVGEIVAWPDDFNRRGVDWSDECPPVGTTLYTEPQPRKRLTYQEIDKAWRSVDYTVPYDQFRIDVACAIEAAVWGDGK